MSSKYPAKTIKKIRKEVLNGKTKYQVAKEMNICEKMVYYYTNDIPSKNPDSTGETGGFLGRCLHLELLRGVERDIRQNFYIPVLLYHSHNIPTEDKNELSNQIRHKRTFGDSKRISRNPRPKRG